MIVRMFGCVCRHAVLVLALVGAGCNDTALPSDEHTPTQPDVGQIGRFLNCTAPPRRSLVEAEQCQLALLRQACTPFKDCLVSCISAPDGHRVGGGCAHVCARVPSVPGDRLPDGFFECFEPQASVQ